MTIRITRTRLWAIALTVPLLLAAVLADAQVSPDFTPNEPAVSVGQEELEEFVVAYLEVREIQEELNEQVDRIVEESELSVERLHEIDQLAQASEAEGSIELSTVEDRELAEYRDVLRSLAVVQEEKQDEMIDAVENEELTVERFNEIVLGVQSDQELRRRTEQALQERIEELEEENEEDE